MLSYIFYVKFQTKINYLVHFELMILIKKTSEKNLKIQITPQISEPRWTMPFDIWLNSIKMQKNKESQQMEPLNFLLLQSIHIWIKSPSPRHRRRHNTIWTIHTIFQSPKNTNYTYNFSEYFFSFVNSDIHVCKRVQL